MALRADAQRPQSSLLPPEASPDAKVKMRQAEDTPDVPVPLHAVLPLPRRHQHLKIGQVHRPGVGRMLCCRGDLNVCIQETVFRIC